MLTVRWQARKAGAFRILQAFIASTFFSQLSAQLSRSPMALAFTGGVAFFAQTPVLPTYDATPDEARERMEPKEELSI